jgi:hypothetical protein
VCHWPSSYIFVELALGNVEVMVDVPADTVNFEVYDVTARNELDVTDIDISRAVVEGFGDGAGVSRLGVEVVNCGDKGVELDGLGFRYVEVSVEVGGLTSTTE